MKKHGVLARLGQGYPFAKLQSSLENPKISIVAPQSANSFLLALFSDLKGDKPPIQFVVASTGREAEDIEQELAYLDPEA